MERIRILRGIKPQYDTALILTRLGCRRGETELDGDTGRKVYRVIGETEKLCRITAAFRRVRIIEHADGSVVLEDGTVLSGKALAELLTEADEAALMASTAGPGVMERIRELFEGGNAADAVVMDAAASEIADAGLDFVMDYLAAFIRREGKVLTKHRFSPGYGDFNIEQQAHFARLLDIGKIGVTLTETFMLVPEKSVMAIAGIVDMK